MILPALTCAPYKSESRRHDRVCKPKLSWKAATPLREHVVSGKIAWTIRFLHGRKEQTVVWKDECRSESGREAARKQYLASCERTAEHVSRSMKIGRMPKQSRAVIREGLRAGHFVRCGWGTQYHRVIWASGKQYTDGKNGPDDHESEEYRTLFQNNWLRDWGFSVRQFRDDTWRIKRPGLKKEVKLSTLDECVEWAKQNFPKPIK